MGKAKKRGFIRGDNEFTTMSRETAIKSVVKLLNKNFPEAEKLITLFGLSAEELLENGASYELVKSHIGILK